MSNLPALLHDGALIAGMATLIYTGAVITAVLAALLAPTPARRRAAQEVLKILLPHRGRQR